MSKSAYGRLTSMTTKRYPGPAVVAEPANEPAYGYHRLTVPRRADRLAAYDNATRAMTAADDAQRAALSKVLVRVRLTAKPEIREGYVIVKGIDTTTPNVVEFEGRYKPSSHHTLQDVYDMWDHLRSGTMLEMKGFWRELGIESVVITDRTRMFRIQSVLEL